MQQYDDLDNDNVADDGEWNGTLTISGDLTKIDTGYTFNSDGYQDFNIRLKADLDTNCDGDGWEDQDVHRDPEEVRQQALRMGANIIQYAFGQ